MANATFVSDLPPLPAYEIRPVTDLLPFISDFSLSLIAPHIAYWIVSLFFHIIDVYDLFPQYRLHTPEEITQRNLASRYEVARDVVIEQIIQMATTAFLSITDPRQLTGMEDYDVAVWATRVRLAQRALPSVLGTLGLNAAAISKNMAASHPLLAGALAGGHYPFLTVTLDDVTGAAVPAFATWELRVAKAIYWLLIPGFQLWLATCFLDTWQYFWHRAMHLNKWMYSTSPPTPACLPPPLSLHPPTNTPSPANWHARHHRLYVPYAYGALYNHPVEGFVLDTAGAGLAYKATFLSQRMGLVFFVFCTMKTVDDHCGYSLPFDPLQHITSNNAAYHDIHHQSWGIKSNFSQPFFTIWDRLLGTMWKGDVKAKYERTRAAAAGKANGSGDRSANGNGNGNANGGKKKAAAANGKVKSK
jgi:sphinganine C4-monooxygenase